MPGKPKSSLRRINGVSAAQGLPRRDPALDSTKALAALRKMVLRGDFPPSERLTEAAIIARLGTTKAATRMALARLAHDGLLEMMPDKSISVRTWTVVEIWDAIELRAVLEGTAARLACERLVDRRELDLLRGYAQRIEAISGSHLENPRPDMEFFAAYCDLNIRFHTALMDLARCGIVRQMWEQVQSIPFAAPSSTILPEAMHLILKSAIEQHHSVLEAISKRDGTRAENIARTHARLGFTNLNFALRSPKPEAALVRVAQPPLFDSGIER